MFSDLLLRKSSPSALFRYLTPQRLLCPSAVSSQRRWTPRSLPPLQTQHRESQRPNMQLPLLQENPVITNKQKKPHRKWFLLVTLTNGLEPFSINILCGFLLIWSFFPHLQTSLTSSSNFKYFSASVSICFWVTVWVWCLRASCLDGDETSGHNWSIRITRITNYLLSG